MFIPTKHPQRPESIPPARLTDNFVERESKRLVVRIIEEPSAVALPSAFDDLYSLRDTTVGLNTSVPEVVERPKNVVAVAGRIGKLQE